MFKNVEIGDIFGEFTSEFIENYDIPRLLKVSNGDNSNCKLEKDHNNYTIWVTQSIKDEV